jgi:CBS domain-containing protein
MAGRGRTIQRMATVGDILDEKGRDVITIDGDATVFEAVKAMVDANVGAVLVTDEGRIDGIFSERDYLRRIAVEGRTSRDTKVRDVMSSPVIVVNPDTSI